jgi:hypothetical protein
VLQQRAAGEAPLHDPPHVSLLMHLAAAQAPTRMRQERAVRPFVSPAVQVPLHSLVLQLRQNIHTLRSSLCILYSSTASTTTSTNLFTSFTSRYVSSSLSFFLSFFFSLSLSLSLYTCIYISTFSDSCFTAGLYIICMHNMFMIYIFVFGEL